MKSKALLPALLVFACGCAPAIAGDWGSLQANRLTLGHDGTGKATINFVFTDDPSGASHGDRFEVTWRELSDASFELEMVCYESDGAPECSGEDFTMTCQLSVGVDVSTMTCQGDNSWSGYPFEWSRVEEL